MTKMTTGHPDLKMVNPTAAAIDIGSTMHMAAVNPEACDTPIRAFGTFTQDLHALADLHLPRMEGYGKGDAPKNGPALAGHAAEAVRDAIAGTIMGLPADLRRSLTWDQGAEMAQHAQLQIDTGLEIYFCDPQSPWQRGSNENTNGLLRQYFPKGTDLSQRGVNELSAVAHALNKRPRKTLG